MGKSYLDSDELTLGNKWLKTVFFPAINDNFDFSYLAFPTYGSAMRRVAEACKTIYKNITSLYWDTSNSLEYYLDLLDNKGAAYKIDPKGIDDGNNTYKFTRNQLCRVLANLCAKCEIFWDDTQHTPEELRYFIGTPFGKALWDFRCFVSQEPEVIKVKIPTSGTKQATTSTSKASTGAASNGGLLNINNCSGLISSGKEANGNSYVYWIGGEFNPIGKTKPRLHVKPYNAPSPLSVSFKSGQGYDDCVLFFFDMTTASDFLAKAIAKAPSNVVNLEVKKVKTDTNGYFKVNTEFGEAYIKASKLNEMLEQANKEEIDYSERTRKACEALEAFMK